MRIELYTKITPIIGDTVLKPTSPYFRIMNVGAADMIINNNFRLAFGRSFSINAIPIAAKFVQEKILVVNQTQYNITFSDLPILKQGQLIETFIKIV